MRSIRIFAKNMGDPYYEPTIVVHDSRDHTERSRRGPRDNITQKPASIFPDDDEAVLVR